MIRCNRCSRQPRDQHTEDGTGRAVCTVIMERENKLYMEVLTARSTVMRFMVITHVVIPHIPDRMEYCETIFIQNLSNVPL